MSDPLNHLESIWYHSEPSDVPYFENLLRPISWFGLFLQQNDSRSTSVPFCSRLKIVDFCRAGSKNKISEKLKLPCRLIPQFEQNLYRVEFV